MTRRQRRAPLAAFVGSLILGAFAGAPFHGVGWVRDPFFPVITLAATSLGLVVPVLAEASLTETMLGSVITRGATARQVRFDHVAYTLLFRNEAR
jgi:Kef-type K+ transport system membrane component KefB